MEWKYFVVGLDALGVLWALILNAILLFCIYAKTPDKLKPYSKILRQNTFVDISYACMIMITFLQAEADKGDYILFMEGLFKNVPHPWNGFLQCCYLFIEYFSLSAYTIPFVYRYFLIVREKAMSNTKFYCLYLIPFFYALLVSIGVAKSTLWPGWDPISDSLLAKFESDFDYFWRDDQNRVPIFIASDMKHLGIYVTVSGAFAGLGFTYTVAGYCCYATLIHLKQLQKEMQVRDNHLQNQVTYALIGQAAGPCLVGGIPNMIILATWITPLKINRIGIVGVIGLTWTTVMNPLCALWFIKPYRKAVGTLFTCCRKRSVSPVNSMNVFGTDGSLAGQTPNIRFRKYF